MASRSPSTRFVWLTLWGFGKLAIQSIAETFVGTALNRRALKNWLFGINREMIYTMVVPNDPNILPAGRELKDGGNRNRRILSVTGNPQSLTGQALYRRTYATTR